LGCSLQQQQHTRGCGGGIEGEEGSVEGVWNGVYGGKRVKEEGKRYNIN